MENAANEAVFANVPVQISYPSKEKLKTLDYRSKIEIDGQVRIVTIPGYDVCACCAPHVYLPERSVLSNWCRVRIIKAVSGSLCCAEEGH